MSIGKLHSGMMYFNKEEKLKFLIFFTHFFLFFGKREH